MFKKSKVSNMPDLYRDLVNTYALAHPDKSKQDQLSEAQALWNGLKSDPSACQTKVNDLKRLVAKRKAKILSFGANIPEKKVLMQEGPSVSVASSAGGPSAITVTDKTSSQTSVVDASKTATRECSTNEVDNPNMKDDVQRTTPAEIREQKRLDEINANISFLLSKQQKGLGDLEAVGKELKNLEANKMKIKQAIKTLRLNYA